MDWTPWLALPPLVMGALVAVGWLTRRAYHWGQRIEAMVQVADYELQHNGGKSLKDSVDQIKEDVAGLKQAFEDHIAEGK